MKNPQDPRHKKREEIVKSLFSWSFHPEENPKILAISKILKNKKKIDDIIANAAPEWPVEQINRVDLAILRLAVWELAIIREQPPKVIIDEAVELAKTYGGEKTPGFVNGVLGTVMKSL